VKWLAALAAAFCFSLAAPASAQMVSRSEDGAVRYQLGQPVGLEAPVEVSRGDAVWAEYIRPAHVVRTTTAGADRPGEHRAPGVPEGSILFAYTLRGGFAYCPLVAPDAHRVQCYRDFDGDGTFEGSYVTISRHLDAMVFPGGLRGLTGMPRVSYVQANVEDAPVVNGQVVFVGFQRGAPRFRIRVEEEFMQDAAPCTLDDNAQCTVYGVRLRVLALGGDRARIELIGAAPQRSLTVCFNTEAVGDGCR
jgi:hypothetical protein